MKKIFFALVATLGLYSCKEKGPSIDFGGIQLTDTSYVAAGEAPETHRILVEEFTGAACPNCPVAREQLAVKSDANPGRIIVLGIHVFGIPQSAPVHDIGINDFRTQKGTDILNSVFGNVSGIPAAGIDRVPVDGNLTTNRTFWDGAIDERLTVASPVNLHLESSYDATSHWAIIKVKIAYTKTVDFSHALSLVILEDSIIDAQEYPETIDTFYNFRHVLRDYVTPIGGLNIMSSVPSKSVGQVYEAEISYPFNTAWIPKNCHVVAYIHRNTGGIKEVIQAAETELAD